MLLTSDSSGYWIWERGLHFRRCPLKHKPLRAHGARVGEVHSKAGRALRAPALWISAAVTPQEPLSPSQAGDPFAAPREGPEARPHARWRGGRGGRAGPQRPAPRGLCGGWGAVRGRGGSSREGDPSVAQIAFWTEHGKVARVSQRRSLNTAVLPHPLPDASEDEGGPCDSPEL